MEMSNSPTTAASCRPIYHESYFIFDREDLQTLSSASELTSVHNREGSLVELYASESRTATDIIFWSCVVVVLSLLLLSVTFCCHCCLCYVNRNSATRRKNVKMPFLMVFGCGIITAALVLLSFVDSGILFWLEIELNQNLTRQVDSVQYYINITTLLSSGDNETVKQITIDPLFRLQDIRFWITLGCLGCLLVILVITFLSVCICTPVSRSAAPMVTILIVEAVCTLLASVLAGGLFGTLLFFSIICYDLYRLGGDRWCDQTSNAPYEQSLGEFCGRHTLYQFYITGGTYGILIILLVLLQLLGGVYTAVVTHGYRERRPTRSRSTRQQSQQRQHTQDRPRQPQHHQNQQRRPSRNTTRPATDRDRRTGGRESRDETFILRAREASQHQRLRRLNSSTPNELGQDLESQNLSGFNLSTITYPKEAPPSYDEVIRRDSETSSTAPLITTGQSQLQTLSQVPEAVEPREVIDGHTGSGGEENSANSNQEADAIEEETVDA